jgi:hypothetical protein
VCVCFQKRKHEGFWWEKLIRVTCGLWPVKKANNWNRVTWQWDIETHGLCALTINN